MSALLPTWPAGQTHNVSQSGTWKLGYEISHRCAGMRVWFSLQNTCEKLAMVAGSCAPSAGEIEDVVSSKFSKKPCLKNIRHRTKEDT